MTAIVGTQKLYYKAFLFRIEIAGLVGAAFQDMSELSMETADIDQWEGGSLISTKSPGRVTVPNVTLSRGATDDRRMWNWFLETVAAASLVAEPDFKRSPDLVQFNRAGDEITRWTLINAYPRKFVAGAWDNNADANVIESVELRFDFFVEGGDKGL